ncbi:MAG TPA: hypothetical protein VMJ32_11220 [Pirellulales bacterium]|nr:hypothetical protein [Pirellulales bacterium]
MNRSAESPRELWAITAYFNPARYWNRRQNYQVFRQHLNVPLATVELSFDGQFELETDDADILIRKSGGDVMWQKERLLNLALDALPADCQFVLCVDCDVIFLRDDLAAQICRQLERVPLLQPYSLVHHLPPAVPPEQWKIRALGLARPSVAWLIAQGVSPGECLGNPVLGFPGIRAPGHAWAARRKLLGQHGFYDACIIGGGDSALACAAYGEYEVLPRLHVDNEPSFQHYLRWAEPFHRCAQGRVSLVTGDLLHLWHGAMSDRRTRRRHRELASFQFDPFVDIALDNHGCWRWNSPKPAMHAFVANYFFARNEDDVVSCTAAA